MRRAHFALQLKPRNRMTPPSSSEIVKKIAGEQHMQDPPTVSAIPPCWIVTSQEEASTAYYL